jgi:DNA-cytosine methyltransferase
MNVLSLFDGMSCGQLALNRAGIQYDKYFASEIDKYAMKVAMSNFPETIQLGSVVDIDTSQLPKIDLLIGGSPCQSFSFAGKRKGMSTKDNIEILTLEHYMELKSQEYEFEGQSYLFWEYVRILNEVKPTYFLLENVIMGEKWERVISKTMGVNPIQINSALLSAQNRQRLYWTNIGMRPAGLFGDLESIIQQPKDKGILLKDILQDNPNAVFYTFRDNKAENSKIDDKYYLSKEQTDKVLGVEPKSVDDKYFLSDVQTNKVIGDMSVDGQTCGQAGYELGFKENEKASTLLQRDYKGMNNYGINVVVTPIPVDEKYYLSEKMINGFLSHNKRHIEEKNQTGFNWKPSDGNKKANCLRANAALCPTDNSIIENKQPIPVDEKYFVDNLTEKQIQKFNELNPDTDKSGCLTEAIARGGSSDEYMSMLKRNSIIAHDIPEIVRVRKFEVDIENLQKCLKDHRKLSVKEISEKLNVQKSKVEHWFRVDKFFAIPDAEYWMQLKELLEIQTDQFDQSIMEFEEREGTFEKTNRVYDEDGIAPTLTSSNADERILVRKKEVVQLNDTNLKSNGGTQPYQQDRVYDVDGISPALSANKSDLLITEKYPHLQKADGENNLLFHRKGFKTNTQTYGTEGKCGTLDTAQGGGRNAHTLVNSRIRKLTPLECDRLQTVPDNYTNSVSDSQRYKMLGNGWTIDVIAYIFSYIK